MYPLIHCLEEFLQFWLFSSSSALIYFLDITGWWIKFIWLIVYKPFCDVGFWFMVEISNNCRSLISTSYLAKLLYPWLIEICVIIYLICNYFRFYLHQKLYTCVLCKTWTSLSLYTSRDVCPAPSNVACVLTCWRCFRSSRVVVTPASQ